jgi:hypothetical protein
MPAHPGPGFLKRQILRQLETNRQASLVEHRLVCFIVASVERPDRAHQTTGIAGHFLLL